VQHDSEQPPESKEHSEKERDIPLGKWDPFWHPGEDHPLDVIQERVDSLNTQLPAEVHALAEQVNSLQDRLAQDLHPEMLLAAFTAADNIAATSLFNRFGDRKHDYHFSEYFAWIRRRRVIALLRLATAATRLANNLLQGIEPFLQPPDIDLAPPEEGSLSNRSKEEQRMQGIDGRTIEVVSDLTEARRLLTQFSKELPALRQEVTIGHGWMEVRFIAKYHPTLELIDYLDAWDAWETSHVPIPEKTSQPIPQEARALIAQGATLKDLLKLAPPIRLVIFTRTWAGPYVRFRWWRKKGVKSMISLAGLKDYPPDPFDPEGV
jgi:hypothetical protein